MSNRQKYRNSMPNGEDVRKALQAFKDEYGFKAKLSWFNEDDERLVVVVEVFKEINGSLLPICKKRSVWMEGQSDVITRCLQTIYYAFHEAEEASARFPKEADGST